MKSFSKKTILKNWLGLAIAFIPVAALITLIYIRMTSIDQVYGAAVGCSGCFNQSVFIHDLPHLLFLVLAMLLGFSLKNRVLSRIFRLIGMLALFIFISDLVVHKELSTRLLLNDALVFLKQSVIIAEHLISTDFISSSSVILSTSAVIITVVLLLIWPSLTLLSRRSSKALTAMLCIAFIASMFIPTTQYVHNWALVNVVAINLQRGETTAYGEKTVRKVIATANNVQTPSCTPGHNERYDLIVLILESWSPYQSALFSGINDWTPRLDAIAQQNTYYLNMHASGFTTNEGLMGMLGGVELLSTGKTRTPFVTAWGYDRTLPKLLKKNDYYTSFLTTGNLDFSNKNQWLEHIGFDYLEGHDHPFYDGMKRMHFGAAPDEALYKRSLQHLDEVEDGQSPTERDPYLVVIENVSSHHPYVHPHTGERDSKAVFRYMDDTAADFYQALKARNYFEHGRLLIISDHRAMMPVGKDELDLLKRAALSKIPAILIGPDAPQGAVETLYHHTDLLDTMQRSTSNEFCGEHGIRDLLAPGETEPRCIFHGRGDSRDLVNVFCPNGEGTIKLAGDKTSMSDSKGLSKDQQQDLINWLNHYRIMRDAKQEQWNNSHP